MLKSYLDNKSKGKNASEKETGDWNFVVAELICLIFPSVSPQLTVKCSIFQEFEIDKKLGIKGPDDVAKMGIAQYNLECRKIVMRYSSEWEKVVKRIGRWIGKLPRGPTSTITINIVTRS